VRTTQASEQPGSTGGGRSSEISAARKILFRSVPRVYPKALKLHSSEEVKAKLRAFFALDSASSRRKSKDEELADHMTIPPVAPPFGVTSR
jgi:hypothetical protein